MWRHGFALGVETRSAGRREGARGGRRYAGGRSLGTCEVVYTRFYATGLCLRLGRPGLHVCTDIVVFLLQLPAVKASIDAISLDPHHPDTALSVASRYGHQFIVQLLLDTGADPTIPAGQRSPLRRALYLNCHAIAALLRHAIAETNRVGALHKARSLVGAGAAAALSCLQGQLERGKAQPQLGGFARRGRSRNEELQEAAAFAVGLSGGAKGTGLCEDLYTKLLGSMLPAWADKEPEA